ncbi:RHS repeat-associated core domain-containing protein [Catellatospora sichuanensis]|uniref:RHS repeat-associated core domain-containing protein n=1 Tax=Catellatospora sichuanensis TaxID=1969805 RepID=UPI0011822EC8|nr:RHS repeat-associated core domain-containing protein [Catellatospora sichuanensis]
MNARRTGAARVVASLVAAAVVLTPPVPAAAGEERPPGWVQALGATSRGARSGAVPWTGSTNAPPARSVPVPAAKATFPAAATWSTGPAERAAVAPDGTARPVRVGAPGAATEPALTVQVHDQQTARRVGVSGFVFTIGGAARPQPKAAPVTLTVDYAAFADAYGAGYADRLTIVELPDCAVSAAPPAGCAVRGRSLPTRNDLQAKRLAVDVADLGVAAAGTRWAAERAPAVRGVTPAAGTPADLDSRSVTFAVSSDPGGPTGTFAASPLPRAGSWQVAPGSGAFTYAYPITVPAAGAGDAPAVSLNYSSGVVDGLTLAGNTQAGPAGLGWSDFANAYIERAYTPCYEAPLHTADLCWKSDNATISLGGVTGPLIPTNADRTQWRVQSDPDWTITRQSGAMYTNTHGTQYWTVTGPDGTQYLFGYGHMPGRRTNSLLSVPVIADGSGEPCRGAGDVVGACEQGWRWYLDRVVDPRGNVQALLYEREENWYSALRGLGANMLYHRAALLKEITYGGRDWDANTYSARVTFGIQSRCILLDERCGDADRGNGAWFRDVPNDLICTQSATCAVHAPSFFSGRRYSHVRTEVKVGAAWKLVAQHNLIHSFGDDQLGAAAKLQLEKIQHAGVAFGQLAALPPTEFGHQVLDNRADHGSNIPVAMRHRRVNRVTTPLGGTIDVAYNVNRFCDPAYRPARWDRNVRDCFPQRVRGDVFSETGIFHKYLVMAVVERSGTGPVAGPPVRTTYTYQGDPGWGFDTSSFARDDDEVGWSRWAGYGQLTVAKGTSRTQLKLYRGLHEDWELVEVPGSGDLIPRPGRQVRLTHLDGTGSFDDVYPLAGRTMEERQLGTLDGVADAVLQTRRHTYTLSAPPTGEVYDGFLYAPIWAGVATTLERVYVTTSAFKERRSHTTYGVNRQPVSTLEEGWLDTTGDERCTLTGYAGNGTGTMRNLVSVNRTVAGGCTSTQVLHRTETYYDDMDTLGAAPVKGLPTRQRTQLDATRWSETRTEYDNFGRPVKVTDAGGGQTTTVYGVTAGAPANQAPIRTTVTNALGHVDTTTWLPEFGVAAANTDADGDLTSYSYDAFGRLTAVWQPTEPLSSVEEPSWRFSYDMTQRSVRTRRLTSDARSGAQVTFQDTWSVADGLGRPRQTQSTSPAAGRILVTETRYDERGLLAEQTVEQAFTGTAGAFVDGGTGWLNRDRHRYDELGRQTGLDWYRGTVLAHTTTTAYGVDSVTVTGPTGRKVRERVDAHGRTVGVDEWAGTGWVTTAYGYDLADRLMSVTDPAGSRVDYGYNLAGWRTSQQDPDRGSGTVGYDTAGRRTSVRDARGNEIFTAYDLLGRPTERRIGTATGALLASWTYDTATGGKGRLHRETTYSTAGTWTSETTGYDQRGRALGVRATVPAGLAGLGGTYTSTQTYDRADRVRAVTHPAIGGLAAETVTTHYDAAGLPVRLSGLAEYVWNVAYDDRGRPAQAGYGPRPGGATWLGQAWTYDVDQRRNGAETYLAGSGTPDGVVADHDLVFDASGNLTRKATRHLGQSWQECFGYDDRARLTGAHTVPVTATCESGTPGTGDRAYRHTYGYGPDGRILSRSEQGATTTYSYPAAGAARPHAPTAIGGRVHTWDADGNLSTRAVTGGTETFSWNVEGMLASVAGPGGQTSFIHDSAGNRLLRTAPDGSRTLYLFGHEVTANNAGTAVTAVRPYALDGKLVATRTPAALEYVVTDVDGSVELTVPAGGTPTADRSYTPYGRVRAGSGEPASDRGFIGQIEDATTGLSYLNARYYDTATALFLSPDPVYDTGEPKSLNPYTYAMDNPAARSDPSGLYSAYTWGLELENDQLKGYNRELVAQLGVLGNHIEQLQDVIRQQQDVMRRMATYIAALEAEIRRQATIIVQLRSRVAYLERVVASQRREISRLRRVVAAQDAYIRRQNAIISFAVHRMWTLEMAHKYQFVNVDTRPVVMRIANAGFAAGQDRAQIEASIRFETGSMAASAAMGMVNRPYVPSRAEAAQAAEIAELRAQVEDLTSYNPDDLAWDVLGLVPYVGDAAGVGDIGQGLGCEFAPHFWEGVVEGLTLSISPSVSHYSC